MITLLATYGSGNCFKPQLLMHQLGVAYRLCSVDVVKGETRGACFRRMNPRGTVPFLIFDEEQTVSESNAMLLALGVQTDLAPRTPYELAKPVEWMIFEQTRLEPNISPARFFTTIVPERREEMAERILDWQTAAVEGLYDLETHLAAHDFILGTHYSIADIAVFGYTHVADEAGLDMDAFPAIRAWIGRVEATPNYRLMAALWSDTESMPFQQIVAA